MAFRPLLGLLYLTRHLALRSSDKKPVLPKFVPALPAIASSVSQNGQSQAGEEPGAGTPASRHKKPPGKLGKLCGAFHAPQMARLGDKKYFFGSFLLDLHPHPGCVNTAHPSAGLGNAEEGWKPGWTQGSPQERRAPLHPRLKHL